MKSAEKVITVFVRLMNEGTDVFRPVEAREINDGCYELICTSNYDPDVEEWKFKPGETVQLWLHEGVAGDILVATKH